MTVEEIIGEVSIGTEAKIINVPQWGDIPIVALDRDSIKRIISVLAGEGYEIVRKSDKT